MRGGAELMMLTSLGEGKLHDLEGMMPDADMDMLSARSSMYALGVAIGWMRGDKPTSKLKELVR